MVIDTAQGKISQGDLSSRPSQKIYQGVRFLKTLNGENQTEDF